MVRRLLVTFLLLTAAGSLAEAQDRVARGLTPYGAFRDTLSVQKGPPFKLRPFVLKGSETVVLNGAKLDTSAYRLNYSRGMLRLQTPPTDPNALLVATYRTLPAHLQQVYRRQAPQEKSSSDDSKDKRTTVQETLPPSSADKKPFGGSQLRRSGSISRGIITGNRQDLTVESGLRMQMAGDITDNIHLEAVLTDQNTPIQPNGTTQRLQDLDRVFMRMNTPYGAATMGDFEFNIGENTYARFSRKLQGASVQASLPDSAQESAGGSLTVAGAVSRGVYRYQKLEPVDGLQGPYRLQGKHGEPFIIVIAGSEHVYLDGNELTRGENNDYIIDYATGEITFTSKHLITADTRLAVEFEYTTNQYSRTLLGAESTTHLGTRSSGRPAVELGARVLREADSRFFARELGFSSRDSAAVVRAGDGPAVVSGAQKVPFDSESPYVQYVKKDTLYNGRRHTIFTAARTAVDSVYQVRFTRMPGDSASYRRAGGAVNGISYEWVGPGQGQYEPVRMLSKPRKKQLLDFTGSVEAVDGVELFGEWAQSVHDENRLSSVGTENDLGGAYRLGARLHPLPLTVGHQDLGTLSATVSQRQTGARFEPFNRTRAVEFNRRWNIARPTAAVGAAVAGQSETETGGKLMWAPTTNSNLSAEWGQLTLGTVFQGQRQSAALQLQEPYWPQVSYNMAYINSTDSTAGEQGSWLQQQGVVRKPLWDARLTPFVAVEHERRLQHSLQTGGWRPGTFTFSEWRPGVEWESRSLSATTLLEYRAEQRVLGDQLEKASTTWTGKTHLSYRADASFRMGADLTYRAKRFAQPYQQEKRFQNTKAVALRWHTRWQPEHQGFRFNSLYEATTEQTPILQETYLRTGVELGEYVWEDANQDSIRQVDEFIPERTPMEGSYAKTFVPSDKLVPVITGRMRLRLALEPRQVWSDPQNMFQKALSSVSSQTTVEISEESTTDRLQDVYLLQVNTFQDPASTVDGRLLLGERLSLFKHEQAYGASVAFRQHRSMQRRTAGFQQHFKNRWEVQGRYRPVDPVEARLRLTQGQNRSANKAFRSRSYDIDSWGLRPKTSIQWTPLLKTSLEAIWSHKTDRGKAPRSGQSALVLRTPFEVQYARRQSWLVSLRFERAQVNLDGQAYGMAAYELTDGRGPGTSYLWHLSGRYSINRFLKASFSYDGRLPEETAPVHTVRVELSAVF